MGFNFPNTPTEGTVYSTPTGQQYVYANGVWLQAGFAVTPLMTAQPRNRILNPAFQVSQEHPTTVFGPSTALTGYNADQWYVATNTSPGTASLQRVQVTTPNGSLNRFRLTVGTAKAALGATDYVQIIQNIEGNRVADFRYGSASAQQSVLRFGFKGPAGTYSAHLSNSATNRCYVVNFTISAGQANTDTVQTLVIPGDVTGTWLTDTGIGIGVRFCLASGATYVGVAGWQSGNSILATASNTNGMATAGNVFEIFDVGLHLDPQNTGLAPPWQPPVEAEELIACRRYFETSYNVGQAIGSSTSGFREIYVPTGAGNAQFPGAVFTVHKRVVPTIAVYPSNGGASGNVYGVVAGGLRPVNLEAPNETAFNLYVASAAADLCRFHYVANARM